MVTAVLRVQLITLNAYIRKEERAIINNLRSHLKKLEKGQIKYKVSIRRKEIIRIRKMNNRKSIEKIK